MAAEGIEKREQWQRPLVVGLCLAASKVAGHTVTADLYAAAAPWCPLVAQASTLVGACAFLAVFLAARLRPTLFDRRLLAAIAVSAMATAALVLVFALPLQVPWAALVAFGIQSAMAALLFLFLVCALPSLEESGGVVPAVVVGLAAGEVIADGFPPLPPFVALALVDGLTLVMVGLLYRLAAPVFARIALSESPALLEIANPESFLAPTSALIAAVVLFHVATGFGLTLGEVEHAPADYGTVAVVVGAATLWLLLSRSADKEDTLFSFSLLTVVAAYLVAPFTFAQGASTANALMAVGTWCFGVLVWLVVAAIGRRNLLALVPAFALLRCVGSLGTVGGAALGRTVNGLVEVNGEMAAIVSASALFLFIAVLWTAFRTFSFSAVVRNLAPLGGEDTGAAGLRESGVGETALAEGPDGKTAEAPVAEPAPRTGADGGSAAVSPAPPTLEERCEAIGREHGLTRRETEIFAMLARGRNGQFLMDHYVVSRNTIKSHIKHIYAKLGVHSQQELIDLVERAV